MERLPIIGHITSEGRLTINKYKRNNDAADIDLYWYTRSTDQGGPVFRLDCIVIPKGRSREPNKPPPYQENSIIDGLHDRADLPRAARFLVRLRALYDPAGSDRRQAIVMRRADQEALNRFRASPDSLTNEDVFGE